ncbi:hypothetical protein [Streptomyces sp. NPDC056291]|uniref:hypothetical protein n=1 Tax=Streptomyces sp. NPDC056291 TaxID=3345772 RepID=UPI0035E3B5AA
MVECTEQTAAEPAGNAALQHSSFIGVPRRPLPHVQRLDGRQRLLVGVLAVMA